MVLPLNGIFTDALLDWFRVHGRELPWRRTYDPYHVWISEIMLQQTQMERGVGYFLRWIERFPDVASVADAKQQEILKYWEGLGYYARARNLHRAAELIVTGHEGIVPCEYDTLLRLPGIGPYTAAAIASVAGNADVVVVDANVLRLFARLLDIDSVIKEATNQTRIRVLAEELLPEGKARLFNQGLMDLGGVICTPKNPQCSDCPVRGFCLAYANDTVALRPVLKKAKETVFLKRLAAFIEKDGMVFIQQRRQDEVWGGLWEFPGGEGSGEPRECLVQLVQESVGLKIVVADEVATVCHQYTNHRITLCCYRCSLADSGDRPVLNGPQDGRWVDIRELRDYGFPAGPRKILEKLSL